MNEEKLKEKIIAILLEYQGKSYTNKTVEQFVELVYQAMHKQRTSAQNRALHKDFDLIAEKMNDAGYDVRKTIKVSIPFTTQIVKDYIWRPFQKKMFSKESTTELERNSGEIQQIHEVVMRELGERLGIEYHDFPYSPEKRKEFEDSILK